MQGELMADPFPVALVGIGKIARDQHIPAIAGDPDFRLVAAVSRNETVAGVPNFTDLDRFLAEGPPAAVALCVPPKVRTAMALKALAAGRDVLLEKPPAATLGVVELLVEIARKRGVCLFATGFRGSRRGGRRRRAGWPGGRSAGRRSSGGRTCDAGIRTRPGSGRRVGSGCSIRGSMRCRS
jgi:predicted dehydrogenase